MEEEEEQSPVDSDYGDKIEMFRSITGEEDTELLRGLLARIGSADVHDDAFIVLSPDADKAHRTVGSVLILYHFAALTFSADR